MASATYETVLDQVRQLSADERRRLIAEVTAEMGEGAQAPRRSSRGVLADLGPAPPAEDIDEARREMWANFPRDDIA